MTQQNHILGTEKIMKLIFQLSGPIVIGIMIQGVYILVDTFFVAYGVGTLAIGGLSIVMPVQLLMYSIGIMLGYGMASIMARRLGENNPEQAGKAAGNAMLTGILSGLSVTVLVFVFMEPLLSVLGATRELLPFASTYLKYVLIGITFVIMTSIFADIFRSEGKAHLLMVTILIGAVLNVILDWAFIFSLQMGVKGAAVATVLSQVTTFVVAFYFLAAGKIDTRVTLAHFKPDAAIQREILFLGIPQFFHQFGLSLIIVIVNAFIEANTPSDQAELLIGAFGILWRVYLFLVLPLVGFSVGYQTIVGYNYGAKMRFRVMECIRISLVVTTAYSVLIFVFMIGFPGTVMRMFTSDPNLIATGIRLSPFLFALFPASGLFFVGTNLFLALGKARISFFLSTSRNYFFLIPLALMIPFIFGIEHIWYAFPFADTAANLLIGVFLASELKRLAPVSGEIIAALSRDVGVGETK